MIIREILSFRQLSKWAMLICLLIGVESCYTQFEEISLPKISRTRRAVPQIFVADTGTGILPDIGYYFVHQPRRRRDHWEGVDDLLAKLSMNGYSVIAAWHCVSKPVMGRVYMRPGSSSGSATILLLSSDDVAVSEYNFYVSRKPDIEGKDGWIRYTPVNK